MKIGLIDVDGHNFPNIPLMKISAYHKSKGDSVEWYGPMFTGHCDKVYMSKVFSFSPDYQYFIDADEIIKGGSGYCISVEDGKEVFDKSKDIPLPYEIEHIYPDYSLYFNDNDLEFDNETGECLGLSRKEKEKRDTAYGFLTRGCPRGCDFCIVKDKEGNKSVKVANLSEFWNGQKNIDLLDPNMFACKDWEDLSGQLIESNAWVNFNQGCDIRIMTDNKIEALKNIKVKQVHFAWDRYEDKDLIVPKFKAVKELTGWDKRKLPVYVLVNFNTTLEQDLERIYTLRDLGFWPYVMVYEKEKLPKGHVIRQLQRWVNMRACFESTLRFEDYGKV
jgi:hypothetical protein